MKTLTLLSTTAAALLITAISQQALAATPITLGQPAYGGNGCPAGSASATVSPDGQALSILFDSYMAEAGGDNAKIARKSCNLTIPVEVPNGFSVSLISADYRGFVDVPAGASARLDSEYFFAGTQGPKFSHIFNGPYSNSYTKKQELIAASNIWSPCGASVNLRVNTGLFVKTKKAEALASVDSADFKSGLVYQVQYRTCRR